MGGCPCATPRGKSARARQERLGLGSSAKQELTGSQEGHPGDPFEIKLEGGTIGRFHIMFQDTIEEGFADADPRAAPRGLAIRFRLPDGSDTDLVTHSYNGFPAKNPKEFQQFFLALRGDRGPANAGRA
jgi:hypothetical protein